MKGLPTLIRLHQWRLDQKRRELAELERLLAGLIAQLDKLEAEVKAEQAFAANSETMGFAYASFAAAAIERRKKLEQSMVEANVRIVEKHAEVTAAFHEVKRYEIAHREALRRAAHELARIERAELDEIALNSHRLKTAAAAR